MSKSIDVLFIEDNPGDARLIKEELYSVRSKTNIHLEWVDCLKKGLDYLAAHTVHAILLDLSLPDSQGLETVERVLGCAPQIPVIVMTGLADEETGILALQAGAQDYLVKGEVDGRLLTRVIRYAIQRKQTEQQLADVREFTERIVTSSPVGIFTYKLSGECWSANAAAARMVGATVEQLRNQNFHHIQSWKQSGLYDMAMQTISTGKPTSGDVYLVSTFGREAWYTAQFVLFRSGGEELLLLIFNDISERKQAEVALKASEQFTQETLDSLTSHIAILDETGTIIAVNRSWREFAQANGADPARVCEGVNYLVTCYAANGDSAGEALHMAQGMQAVMDGEQETFSLEYPCHSPEKKRWFVAHVTRFKETVPVRIVVAHEDITERKEAESALAASEQRFRAWIENSSDIVTVLDAAGVIQYESPSVKRLLGYEPEQLLGKNAFDFVHPEDQARILAAFEKNMRDPNSAVAAEFRFRHQDESWRYLEGIGRAYMDEHQEVVGLIHSRDITERKQVEAEVVAIQKRFQALIENAPDGIALLGLDGRLRQVTPSTQQILGYSLEEAQGQDPALLTHPDDLPMLSGLLHDLIQKPGEVIQAQYRFKHRDGRWRWLDSTISNLMAEPSVQSIVFNYRDITERKQAEQQIQYQANLLANVNDAIVASDANYVLTSWNAAAERMYGWKAEEVLGRTGTEILQTQWAGASGEEMRQAIRQSGGWRGEATQVRKDGARIPVEISSIVLRGENGQLAGFASVNRDITERKKTHEQILLQAELLAAVGSAVIATDLEGRVIYWNAAAERLYGWTVAEAVGRSTLELTVAGPSEEQAREIMKQLTAGKSWSGEFPLQRKDGTVFPAFVSDSPLLDSQGKLIGIIGVSNDITAVKQAEAALKASEQRYRDLTDNFPNGVVCVYNRDLILVFDAGLELKESGYKAEDFVGKHFSELAPAATWEIAKPHLDSAFEGKVSAYEAAGFEGQYYSVSVAPLHNALGQINEILVVSQNITNLKKTELSLHEKEHLLSEAQRIGQIGSWSYEFESDALKFSDEMYRLLDVLPEEFQHNRDQLLALIYPSDRPAAAKWMEDMRRGTQAKVLSFRILHRNGELRYLHCTGAVDFDVMARPIRFIGTMQDVTERRIAEIQIDQQLKRLTALSEIDRTIIASFDCHYILGVILSQVVSQLQADAADILLLEPDGETLTFAVGQGFRSKAMEAARVRLGESHAGRAAKERRMIRIPDLREVTNILEFGRFVTLEGFVSYVGVPLIVKGKAKGVLEVYQRSTLQPYQEWLDFLQTLAGQAAIAIENTSLFSNLHATNLELTQAYDATIEGWSRAMDLRDRETEGHTQRVTSLTLELARAMGMDESRLIHIRRGALLHDIGKLGVPDHILFKPGQLTPEEREIIEKHVDFAYEMLAPIPYLKPALNIPYFHHEKWDGTGYPLGLKGEQIPLEARIFALVDVWDALMSDRPYRKAWTPEKTIEYIRSQSGTHFDPRVVEYFLEWIHKTKTK